MLQSVALISMSIALITTLIFARVSHAAPGINKTMSLQGRMLTASGAVVSDGYYNIQFKIYQDGLGTTVENPGGTLKWTETYANNNNNEGVLVKNGFFSVSLGSKTPFGTSVDWNQDTLWLSMNVAGSAAACTTFGDAPCVADGEMLPMKQLTATPYAMNAGAVGGKTADNFVQLAQGVQTDASTNTSSIHINKTGTGNIIQLQNTGSDVFTVKSSGDLAFGKGSDHLIEIDQADADTAGDALTIRAGGGGDGTGSIGGDLFLQGGSAGGTNADGGSISISGGEGTGTGQHGNIYIGATNTDTIQIGSADLSSGIQTIAIGNNNTPGGTTNVTIGSSEGASGGTTSIQSKDDTTITTDGTQRARFSGDDNILYVGNADSNGEAATANGFKIQGTSSSAADTQGGSLSIQAGSATNGNANGGNLTLSGGDGSGTGATGLVVINTPTFQTSTSDANCYTSGALVSSSCTFTHSSVNSSAVLIAGFSTPNQTATLPDPTITTAGRIMYVTAANGSEDFALRINSGDGTGVEQSIALRKNTTATLVWNGSDWTTAGASPITNLQDSYNNTPQSAGGVELTLNNSSSTNGLTIRDSSTNPVNGTLLEVQNAGSNQLFSVNGHATDGTQYATEGTAHSSTGWSAVATATVSRTTSDGHESGDSIEVAAGTVANNGVRNELALDPQTNTRYRISTYIKLLSGSDFSDLAIAYSPDNGLTKIDCVEYNTQIVSSEWAEVSCYIETGATAVTDPYVYLTQPTTASSARTFLVDSLSVTAAPTGSSNVKIGNGSGQDATLFTLDKSASAPTNNDSSALIGSMYYDTTLGKVQCYEAEGWGACGASPDNFVTISPEYTNAVISGTGIGSMDSDVCSDALNINDGSSGQPTICGTNETYNFYKWTSEETTAQTRSIFVTYQLPTSFKEFIAGSTSVMGRTDSADSSVNYQVYRNNSNGLAACGSVVSVSTGSQSTWQKVAATGSADPSTCDFSPGDSIVIRINLQAKDDANAYAGNLGFTFSNN